MSKKDIEVIYPLSASQQGILFETLSAPESGIHIEQLVVTFHGDLNITAFEQAWNHVVKRQPLLRTGFVWKNQNEPLQFVQKQVEVTLEQQDWRELSSLQQSEQREAVLEADRRRGFKLIKPPLIGLALFQTGDRTYDFLWTLHHILMDGWCLPLILKEVFASYQTFISGQNLFLNPTRPYRDYITWLKQQDLSQAEMFWGEKLKGFTKPTPLGIETQTSSLSGQQKRYGEHQIFLDASITAKLKSVVRQHNLTLNNLIQGVWALLLSRYSQEEDVIFGATVSGRPPGLAGVESMIGLFINTLPMRIKVSPDTLFWRWLKDIQEQHLEQQAYEYCSAGQVHQWSQVPSSLPLYESILVFENYPVDSSTLQFSDLTIDVNNLVSKGAQTKYALTILVIPGSQIELKIVYDSYRLDSPYINWILEHFLVLLNSILAIEDQQLAALLSQIPSEQIPQVRLGQNSDRQDMQESFVAPRDGLELQLAKIWEDVLNVQSIGVRDNFFDLGGHSLLAIRLMTKIQQHFDKNLPLATLFENTTIEKLANVLQQDENSSTWEPLVAIKPNGSKRPLFCVPGAGGNVVYFYHLVRYLDSDRPFYGLQARGLDSKQAPHTTIEEIAADYIKAIQVIQPHGPYLLGGHSFGGYVAFEMALQLQQQGHEVDLLAIIDTPAPISENMDVKFKRDDAKCLTDITLVLERLFGKDLSVSYEDIQPLEADEQLQYVLERLKSANIFPQEASLAQIRSYLQIFKTNLQTHYLPQSVYPNRITFFRASEPLQGQSYNDPAIGWNQLSSQPIEIYDVPGDHITILASPHVQILAEQLRGCLKSVSL